MIKLNGAPVEYTKFSGGEIHIDLSKQFDLDAMKFYYPTTHLSLSYRSNDDLIALLLLVNAFRKVNTRAKLTLHIDYMPYGRQDRTTSPGTSFALKVAADMLNTCGFERVTIDDAHNAAVCEALIHNFVNVEQHDLLIPLVGMVQHNLGSPQSVLLIAPDEGAVKKSQKMLAKISEWSHVKYANLLTAMKSRDPRTGEIKGIYVPELSGEIDCPIYIFDDIIDGGRTFIELSKVVRPHMGPNASIHLFATVGIFSKGRAVVEEYFDTVSVNTDFTKKESI